MELWRGSSGGGRTPRLGSCWAERPEVAVAYCQGFGTVLRAELDLRGLVVVEVDGYDRDENWAPGDGAEEILAADGRPADILVYEDEDLFGRLSTTWRLVSERAVRQCRVLEVLGPEEV